MIQFRYHTEATMEYMEDHQEKFSHHKDVFCRFCASKSTMMVSEALKTQLTMDKLGEQDSNPAWNNLSAAAKGHHIDKD